MLPNVCIVRHAQTYGNTQTERSGYSDELDSLTPKGVLQSIQLSPQIYTLISLFSGKVRVHCSEARRTLQTAMYAGLAGFPIARDARLNEFETTENILSTLASLQRKQKQLPPSLLDVQKRIMEFLASLDPNYLNIVLSHGASIGTVYHAVDPSLAHIPKNASANWFYLHHNGSLTLH